MRAIAVHADVVVVTSQIWQTTAAAVRAGEDAFLIDSPVLPEELDALPALFAQGGFAIRGLLATHADWDHLLGRLAFPQAALGVAETTAARLRAEPGQAQRELRDFDADHYLPRAPLALGDWQPLPVPGHCAVGDRELELHPADGHTSDGMALLAPWAGVLCCGDYLSPVEVPVLGAGASPPAYEATLRRLRPLVERAETVVPGHGAPLDRSRALAILDEDLAYLDALSERGAGAPLPPGRDSAAQRRLHARNAAILAS